MSDNQNRDRPVTTPAMIEAGIAILRAKIGTDRWIGDDENIVREIIALALRDASPGAATDEHLNSLVQIQRDHSPVS